MLGVFMQYKTNSERDRKIKLLIISLVSAILVFVVGVILLGVAFGSSSHQTNSTKSGTVSSAKTQSQTTTKPTANAPKVKSHTSTKNTQRITRSKNQSQLLRTGVFSSSKKTSTTPEASSDDQTTFSPANQYQAQSNIPSTGPTEVVFTAVLIGLATTLFLTNINFIKTKQTS